MGGPQGSNRGGASRADPYGSTFGRTGQPSHAGVPQYPRVQPPEPVFNDDRSVTRGWSHKFGASLAVTGPGGEARGMTTADAADNAFLQLQLQECFELINRKDDALKG